MLEVQRLMARNHIRSLPVVQTGRVIGSRRSPRAGDDGRGPAGHHRPHGAGRSRLTPRRLTTEDARLRRWMRGSGRRRSSLEANDCETGVTFMYDAFRNQLPDSDSEETNEWIEALDQVIDSTSSARARYLMTRLLFHARLRSIGLPRRSPRTTSTRSPRRRSRIFPATRSSSTRSAGSSAGTRRRWSVRANKAHDGIGGHLSTYASAGEPLRGRLQPLLPRQGRIRAAVTTSSIQGHAAPGIYARCFLEGRLDEEQARQLQREALGCPASRATPTPG